VLKTNKPLTLYEHPDASYVTCMAARRDGNAVLSGHADSSLHVFYFDDGTGPAGTAKFAQHSCPPTAIAWGADALLVTGNDCKVCSLQSLKPHGLLMCSNALQSCTADAVVCVTLSPALPACNCSQQLCPALHVTLLCSDGIRDVCQVDSQ